MAYSVQLCVVIDEESGELRVPPLVVGSGNEDTALEPDGVSIEWAVSGILNHTVDDVALLVNAEVEELWALRLRLPALLGTLGILVVVAILVVVLISVLRAGRVVVSRLGGVILVLGRVRVVLGRVRFILARIRVVFAGIRVVLARIIAVLARVVVAGKHG